MHMVRENALPLAEHTLVGALRGITLMFIMRSVIELFTSFCAFYVTALLSAFVLILAIVRSPTIVIEWKAAGAFALINCASLSAKVISFATKVIRVYFRMAIFL